jgi:hypothetical protein
LFLDIGTRDIGKEKSCDKHSDQVELGHDVELLLQDRDSQGTSLPQQAKSREWILKQLLIDLTHDEEGCAVQTKLVEE